MLTAEQWMDQQLTISVRVGQVIHITLDKLDGYITDEPPTDEEIECFFVKLGQLIDKHVGGTL